VAYARTVDVHGAGFQAFGEIDGFLKVVRQYRGRQAILGVIGELQRVHVVLGLDYRSNGTEALGSENAHRLRYVREHGGLEYVVLEIAAALYFRAVFHRFVQLVLDEWSLRGANQRTDDEAWLARVAAELHVFHFRGEALDEFVIDA